MRAPRRVAGLLAAAALALAGACTASDGADGSDTLPDGVAGHLTAELRQERTQYADRRAVVHVTNGSGSTVTLLGGALDAPGYGPSSPDGHHRPRTLAPGAGRDVRIRLGDVDCDAAAPERLSGADAQTIPVATATVRLAPGEADDDAGPGDGSGTEVVLDVTDPLARLAAVHAETCAEQLVASGLTLRVIDVRAARVRTPDGVADGGRVTLAADPVPGGPDVRLLQVAGTTLLSPAAGHAWLGDDLTPDADGRVVLELVPARCDPHVVAEDKRGTFLPVHAEVDRQRQPEIYVPMTDAQRAATYDLVHDACGWD
ncbi:MULTISPECIES: hypothetical protein [unclassified Isoptericola]|uniref:hypothetical protein n=1 Tax=unclassified Isoptericola TaxID=2623355 RepID=UPI00366647D8